MTSIRNTKLFLCCLLLMFLASFAAFGQSGNPVDPVDTKFVQGFGVDSVNLQNLAVQIDVPVISKSGMIPFSYVLSGNSSCGGIKTGGTTYDAECGIGLNKFVNPSGGGNWQLTGIAPNRGWVLNIGLRSTSVCATDHKNENTLGKFYLTGPDGATYYLPATDGTIYGGTACDHGLSDTTINGGIAVVATSNGVLTSVTAPNGFTWPSGTIRDTFGNSISASTASGVTTYNDTLVNGALSVTLGSASVGEVDTYHTTGLDGTITSVLTPATIKTAFGCPATLGGDVTQSGNVLSEIDFPDGNNLYFQYEAITGGTTGRLYQITNRTGGTVQYTYGALSTCDSFIPSSLTRTTADGSTTYTFALWTNGASNSGTTTTVLDPGQNKTVYTFAGTQAGTGLPHDPATGTPTPITLTQVQTYQNTGTVSAPVFTLISKIIYCYGNPSTYGNNPLNCPTLQTGYPISQRDIYKYKDTTSLLMSHTTQLFDTYGNITSSTATDSITGQVLTTTTTYSGCGQGSTIKDHPCDIKTVNGANTVAERKFTYNANGAATQSQAWSGSNWLLTNYTPNANGTIASVTAANGQVTTIGYDGSCNSMVPTSSSTTLAGTGVTLSASQTWNCYGAVVTSTTNVNGNPASQFTYDSMFRPLSQTDPTGYQITESYPTATTFTIGDSYRTTTTKVDGLGRVIRKQTTNGVNYDTVTSGYGWLNGGQFQVSGSEPCQVAVNADCPTVHFGVVDPIGRSISSHTVSNETVAVTYSQNDTSSTLSPQPSGEHVKTVQTEEDGFGRPKSICAIETTGGTACGQVMGGSGVVTTYSYSFGSGTKTATVTRGSQVHTTVNDAIGRVTSSTTPEAGTVNYYYDVATTDCTTSGMLGTLTETKSASGIVTCFWYDKLNRLIGYAADHSQTSHTCRTFVYDAATSSNTPPTGFVLSNPKGRVVEAFVNDCNGGAPITDEWFRYDPDGRPLDTWESTPNSGGYYHTTATYYSNGKLNTLSGVPGYPTYTVTLDSNGRPNSSTFGTTTVINSVTRDAASRPTTTAIGTSGDSDGYCYDQNTGKMTCFSFVVNGNSLSGTPTWNTNNTLKSLAITDTFNAADTQTCNFTYDDLVRLTGDNCGAVWNMPATYDQYDNITKSDWSFTYNASNNQMQGVTYNSDGQITNDTVNSYTWGPYNKVVGVRAGATAADCTSPGFTGTCITYDAFGRTAEINNSGTYSQILYGPVGRIGVMSGQTTTSVYLAQPGGPALYAFNTGGSSKIVLHSDWLGTKRLGTVLGSRVLSFGTAYAPYGEKYASTGTIRTDFTGDLSDIFAGLYDTANRELMSNSARFLSPDLAGGSWNAYSYPTDPNSTTDPSGLRPCNPGACTSNNQVDANLGGFGSVDSELGGGVGDMTINAGPDDGVTEVIDPNPPSGTAVGDLSILDDSAFAEFSGFSGGWLQNRGYTPDPNAAGKLLLNTLLGALNAITDHPQPLHDPFWGDVPVTISGVENPENVGASIVETGLEGLSERGIGVNSRVKLMSPGAIENPLAREAVVNYMIKPSNQLLKLPEWTKGACSAECYSVIAGTGSEAYDAGELSIYTFYVNSPHNPFPELYRITKDTQFLEHSILVTKDGIFIDFTAAQYGWQGHFPLVFKLK